MFIRLLFTIILLSSQALWASVSKDLSYPSDKVNAQELANQVYFVNHFYSFKNYGIGKNGRNITTLVLRDKGDKPLTIALERYLNNNYSDGKINARDLAIFRSGKLKGTAMLITDFVDQSKSQSYEIFIPAIRKIRRFAQPAHDDAWGGSDFTFGDVVLRKPDNENHKIIEKTTFSTCLSVMDLPSNQRNKYTQKANIKADCSPKGKSVYKLKSTTKRQNWWYDYRISYIDVQSFADYRTEYFKNNKHIKTIDRSWISANLADKRANYWGYWYGKDLRTEHETLAFIPKSVSQVNHQYKRKKLWSTRTLRKVPRVIK